MNEYFPPTLLLGPHRAQYRLRLIAGDHSARHIRRIARSYLREWDRADLSDAVELGLTELIANVVRHVPDRRCAILLLRQERGVRVEVADGSERLPVPRTELCPESEGGRGLMLLAAVADSWGVTPGGPEGGGGKTVWFVCGGDG
ncbi:ATP-binding protein [Streptomyces sp. NPDC007084]|uniref:ATP-binding protein n=1 Tax=Streptomyces sp. NPDC007084 TaxID=3154313 RepID=UPI003453B827